MERSLRARFSAPTHPNSKKMVQTFNPSTSPKRGSMNNNNKNNKARRSPHANDSTKAFFDCMALTVSSFPQHLQAQVKIQICKIVAQTEYDLSLPKAH